MTSRTHRCFLARAVLLCVFVQMLTSCNRVRELVGTTAESGEPPAASVQFEVDDEGVFYGTLGQNDRLHAADRLADVPLAERVALVVHVNDKTAEFEGHYYIADLVDAAPGDTVTARLRSADEVRKLLDVGEEAALCGLAVGDTARDIARVDTGDVTQTEDGPIAIPPKPRTSKYTAREQGEPDPEREPNMAGEVIELFADAEFTSQTGDVTASGGETGEIEIKHLGASRDTPDSTRRGPISDSASWKSVTMYYANWCGVCRRAKRWLDKNKVPYRLVDIEASKKNKAEMVEFCVDKKAKPGEVPTFRIDGDTIMQGWSAEHFERLATY